jgi:hypothetical protein
MKKILFLTIWIIILITGQSFAATIYAASCSYTDVKTAVDSANSGDTVIVPAGSCIWNIPLVVTKGVILQGAGIGVTNIKGNIIDNKNGVISYKPNAAARLEDVML